MKLTSRISPSVIIPVLDLMANAASTPADYREHSVDACEPAAIGKDDGLVQTLLDHLAKIAEEHGTS